MKIIFAGKFENALIRNIDGILLPSRNASTHEYYAALNRNVTSNYFDRCGTLLVLADETLVPTVDWNYIYGTEFRGELADLPLNINHAQGSGRAPERETRNFAAQLLKFRALSRSSVEYISTLSLRHYPTELRLEIEKDLKTYESEAATQYLSRLLLQIISAGDTSSFIILSDDDLHIIDEIGTFIRSTAIAPPFLFPDLKGKAIEPESFAGGILNFAPPDLRAVAAVRSDKGIQEYAEQIKSLLQKGSSEETERKMLAAMVEAHQKTTAGERAEKIFEVVSWLAKPLHYIPGVDAAMSIAEDIKDVAVKAFEDEASKREWHLIAVKMADIAIRDYLERKSNILGQGV